MSHPLQARQGFSGDGGKEPHRAIPPCTLIIKVRREVRAGQMREQEPAASASQGGPGPAESERPVSERPVSERGQGGERIPSRRNRKVKDRAGGMGLELENSKGAGEKWAEP